MRQRRLGNPTAKAWIAGWDASITFERNPYRRRPQREAFERGRAAGLRSGDEDARQLMRRLGRQEISHHN